METNAERRSTLRWLARYAEAEPQSQDDFDEELRLHGLNPEEVRREQAEFLRRVQGRVRLLGAQTRFQSHQQRLPDLQAEVRRRMGREPSVRGQLMTLLRQGTIGDMHFRNLESLPDEDLLEMLNETQLLDFLNGLDNPE